MATISMLELRRNAKAIIQRALRGERMVLTYRGRPVVRLEPVLEREVAREDPFYTLDQLADAEADPLTNEEIDGILYGS